MLTVSQIARMADAGQWRQLVRRVLENGRCGCPEMVERLSAAEAAPPAAAGLALQRLAELTYVMPRTGEELARRALAMQRDDGLFGCANEPDATVAATAAAARGLLEWLDRRPSGGGAGTMDLVVREAVERGLAALGRLQRADGSVGRDMVDGAIVLWQLAGRREAEGRLRWGDLGAWLDPGGRARASDRRIARFARAAA